MPIKKILITVTTYPLPSRSYDELVCTAGFLEDGSSIRIYPVPLSFLNQVKKDVGFKKYTWIELDIRKRTDEDRKDARLDSLVTSFMLPPPLTGREGQSLLREEGGSF